MPDTRFRCDPAPILYTVTEAAEAIRMSEGWIHQAIRSGELPVVRFGRAVRIRVADLNQYVEGKIVGTAAAGEEVASGNNPKQVIEKTLSVSR